MNWYMIYCYIVVRKCKTCGKVLTSRESRKLGYGPECRSKPPAQQEILEQQGQIRMEGL